MIQFCKRENKDQNSLEDQKLWKQDYVYEHRLETNIKNENKS